MRNPRYDVSGKRPIQHLFSKSKPIILKCVAMEHNTLLIRYVSFFLASKLSLHVTAGYYEECLDRFLIA